jgi:hypothetical protein
MDRTEDTFPLLLAIIAFISVALSNRSRVIFCFLLVGEGVTQQNSSIPAYLKSFPNNGSA